MSRRPHPAPSLGAWPFWLRLLLAPESSRRSLQPSAGTGLPDKARAIVTKAGEYELLESDRLVFRVASNTGGGAWDKSVEVGQSFSTANWYHALFWIEPGEEIGLALNGGTPETEALASGQAARVVNGVVRIGLEVPQSSSSSSYYPSSSHHSSSWHSSSSSWFALSASAPGIPQYYEGLVDEIAVFNEALGAGWRSALYNGWAGLFWHAAQQQ